MKKSPQINRRLTFFVILLSVFFSGFFVLSSAYSLQNQLDLNKASFEQIRQLPISYKACEEIYTYLLNYKGFTSVYDLRNIKDINAEKFEEIKPMVKISKPEVGGEQYLYIYRIQKSLAVEEGPTKAAVEEWQDMLITPMNINKASIDDMILLENVSLIDAIAVIKHLQMGQEIKETRDLRDVDGLSNYGYINMRNFVAYTDPKAIKFSGDYRVNFDYGYNYEQTENEPITQIAYIDQSYYDLSLKSRFYDAGLTDNDIDKYYQRIYDEREYLVGLTHRTILNQRFRARIGNNFIGGLKWQRNFNPGVFQNDLKGFISANNIAPFKKVFLGDFRVTLGQGILLDNSAELIARTYNRSQGIYGDLTDNSFLSFRGIGGQANQGRLKAIGFYSKAYRDGIENPDGTINYYVINELSFPTNHNTFVETNTGLSAGFDLSDISVIPTGSYLGFNTLACRYNKDFSTLAKWLDLPGDVTYLDDPNYVQTTQGNKRDFYSFDFRSAIENISMEGEYAWQRNGGMAYLLKARAQYEYLYLLTLLRHYDVNYDNPYNRGFCEQFKFEDTPLEKPYRLIDPTFSVLQYFPSPKAEQGLYTEIRYQLSRQITITRAYMDIWRNLAYGVNNFRFQGELEYRPVFPFRFRLRQKVQFKHLPKDVLATTSNTYETSFRFLISLTDRNFLSCEYRRGSVGLTPSMEYNSQKTLWGDFLGVSWEHNFSDAIGLETGLTAWKCDGLSQWIFEDVGIDFLDGRGLKYYFVMTQRPTNFLLLRFKFKSKFTELPHTGILATTGLHYSDGSLVNARDFITHNDIYNVGLQIDFLW
jgi:DNA uptake protein ComE-like DNA-binding protein